MNIFNHLYAVYLGAALADFGHISFTQWEFYAIFIPTVLLVNFRD